MLFSQLIKGFQSVESVPFYFQMIQRDIVVNMVTYRIVRKFFGIFLLYVFLFYNILQTRRILWMCRHIWPVLVPQQLLMLHPYLVQLKSKSMDRFS